MNFEMSAYLVRTEQRRDREHRVTRRGARDAWPRPRPGRRARIAR
jgi:hypothetical protein